MSFINFILNKKEKKKYEFPYHFIRIVWTESAIRRGIFDDFQKEIQRIKGGRIVEVRQYTEQDLNAMIQVYEIPSFDYTRIKEKEEFQFESMDSLSGTFSEVIQQ